MAKYRVLSGIDYPPNMRAEAGDVVEDLPPKSIKWLLDSNIIEPADKATADIPVEEVVKEVVVEATPEPIVEEVVADADVETSTEEIAIENEVTE